AASTLNLLESLGFLVNYKKSQLVPSQQLEFLGENSPPFQKSTETENQIAWWRDHLLAWNGRALFQKPIDLIIETDASRKGWGAYCQGISTGGPWCLEEKRLHINCLELLAGSLAIKTFTKDKVCAHVKLLMDNTAAVAYINKSLVMNWGPLEIDLFASRLTYQLPQFVSWRPDPLAVHSDAFSISRCLQQLSHESPDQRTIHNLILCFLSHIRPFKPVSSSTLARWIKRLLSLAGIDTAIFSAHSLRGAATSEALNQGMRSFTKRREAGAGQRTV
ncbi:Transposon Ty3-G Gag-Pol poly, partial [Paramuricea clavata]